MPTTDFRKQIKLLMIRKKIKAAELSRITNLNPGTVYNYLSGKMDAYGHSIELMINKLNEV